mgnify:CR=1 FL=1
MSGKIVCVGNIVHDEVFHIGLLPSAGVKTAVLDYEERFGGPAATAAVAICRLGGTAAYWGRVGPDAARRKALHLLAGFGVDCDGVAVLPEGRTLRAIVLVDARGERSIVSDRRGLANDPAVLPVDDLRDAAAVLADTRWAAGARVALARARKAGIATILDADGGTPDDNQRLVEMADHVVFSAEGLRDHAGAGEPETLLRRCAAGTTGKVFAVTRGAAGSLWLIEEACFAVPSFPVRVRDTTGCGDVFHGAYALALSERRRPLDAALFASAVAAIKAQRGDGWNGMADRRAVEELLATNPQLRALPHGATTDPAP